VPTNHIGRGNVFVGYNNNLEYIIKIENKAMASIISELVLWTENIKSTL
jgi:hypothetical protein